MVIAVNTRLLLPGKMEGIGWFTYENLRRITVNHPEHQFIFIFDRKYDEKFIFNSNVTPVIANPPSRHPILWYLFFEYGVPPVLKKFKADLFFSPDGWLSLRTKVKSLPVIHDLNFMHEPQWVSRAPRYYYNHFFPKFAQKANRIATVSEFSKQDITNRFQISPENIDVVYNGANESYTPINNEEKNDTRKRFSKSEEYFLFVGLVHPRKNLTRIIRAFNIYKQKTGRKEKLIIVGSTAYWTSDTSNAFENSAYKDDIIFVGRLEPIDLHKVFASAKVLVFASLFEGFGIPILESMYCDVPVITSDATSMPEIGGEAAIYVDPYSTDSIAEAMIKITADENLYNDLIVKGRVQRRKFSWDNSASLVWNAIEKTLEQ